MTSCLTCALWRPRFAYYGRPGDPSGDLMKWGTCNEPDGMRTYASGGIIYRRGATDLRASVDATLATRHDFGCHGYQEDPDFEAMRRRRLRRMRDLQLRAVARILEAEARAQFTPVDYIPKMVDAVARPGSRGRDHQPMKFPPLAGAPTRWRPRRRRQSKRAVFRALVGGGRPQGLAFSKAP